MTTQNRNESFVDWMNQAIADAIKASQDIADKLKETAGVPLYQFIEHGTETIGKVVAPISDNPVIRFATKVPVLSWLAAALGQVNVSRVQADVEEMRQQYPLETADQLAQRVMVTTAWKAAGIGLVMNAIPPLALTLFAVDLGAIAALQAEMIYRIAAIYDFSPTDPTRRGEVLALWGISTGGSGVLKSGLSLIEVIPGVGTVVGVASGATLIYTIGYLACLFYAEKRRASETTSSIYSRGQGTGGGA
jgi:uncharacterized protein (DUF697 family)